MKREIGIVSTAAVIANAAIHATGVRVRDLPITIAPSLRFILLTRGCGLGGGCPALARCRSLGGARPPLPRLRRLLTRREFLCRCHLFASPCGARRILQPDRARQSLGRSYELTFGLRAGSFPGLTAQRGWAARAAPQRVGKVRFWHLAKMADDAKRSASDPSGHSS
jgi:hypothetical protein